MGSTHLYDGMVYGVLFAAAWFFSFASSLYVRVVLLLLCSWGSQLENRYIVEDGHDGTQTPCQMQTQLLDGEYVSR